MIVLYGIFPSVDIGFSLSVVHTVPQDVKEKSVENSSYYVGN